MLDVWSTSVVSNTARQIREAHAQTAAWPPFTDDVPTEDIQASRPAMTTTNHSLISLHLEPDSKHLSNSYHVAAP